MALLPLIFGLTACQKKAERPKHQLFEITSVSISSAHINQLNSYSFFAHKEKNNWFFDAEYFANGSEIQTQIKNQELSSEETEKLFNILSQNGSIAYCENYKNSRKLFSDAVDEDVYAFCLSFSDGKQFLTKDRQKDLELYFYHLSEKYGK